MQMEEVRGRAEAKFVRWIGLMKTSGLNGSSELVGAHLTFRISASLAGLCDNFFYCFYARNVQFIMFLLIC